MNDESVAISPLVADLLTSMLSQTHATTEYVIDRLTEQLAEANARIAAVEFGIKELFAGPYMPTPAAVIDALYPDQGQIDSFREGHR